MKRSLVWFHDDLRVGDNPALSCALAESDEIVPVFIWAPHERAPWAPGAASRWWLHHSLLSLSETLQERGSELVILRGPTQDALQELVAQLGARAVYWNRRYEPALMVRDRTIKAALAAQGVAAKSFNGKLLLEPWEIQNGSKQPYRVFTPFHRACLRKVASLPSATALVAPKALRGPVGLSHLTVADLQLLPKLDWAKGLADVWQPGEAGAQKRLAKLKTLSARYATDRDRPDLEGTTRLSPHLAFGEVSPRQVLEALAGPDGASQCAEIERQLYWREFAYHLLYHFPHTTLEPLRAEFAGFPWCDDEDDLKAWQRGTTGEPLVDAAMQQLWQTGWMHNRARMVVGSFLVKNLLLPWQEGARWFWDTLVDADLANNTLGWQWVAGSGADAAPYFRIFNPETQAEKFDPAAKYRSRWRSAASLQRSEPLIDPNSARKRALMAYHTLRSRTAQGSK
jgi:deoxyribodipyrimidine photo-lyase